MSILLDELALAALSDAASALRKANDPLVPNLENSLRTHRVGIVKQRAILGAAGVRA